MVKIEQGSEANNENTAGRDGQAAAEDDGASRNSRETPGWVLVDNPLGEQARSALTALEARVRSISGRVEAVDAQLNANSNLNQNDLPRNDGVTGPQNPRMADGQANVSGVSQGVQTGGQGGTNNSNGGSDSGSGSTGKQAKRYTKFMVPAVVVGGAAAVLAAPLAVAAAGFGAGGIAAGSMAAGMMSSAWTTGLGVGIVSTLQSVGAAGMGVAGTMAAGGAGAGIGAGIGALSAKLTGRAKASGNQGDDNNDNDNDDDNNQDDDNANQNSVVKKKKMIEDKTNQTGTQNRAAGEMETGGRNFDSDDDGASGVNVSQDSAAKQALKKVADVNTKIMNSLKEKVTNIKTMLSRNKGEDCGSTEEGRNNDCNIDHNISQESSADQIEKKNEMFKSKASL